jgi:hypothetical protein
MSKEHNNMEALYEINKWMREHCHRYDFNKMENPENIKALVNSLLNKYGYNNLEVGKISIDNSIANITIVPKVISIIIETKLGNCNEF